jgi:hypothetical protein
MAFRSVSQRVRVEKNPARISAIGHFAADDEFEAVPQVKEFHSGWTFVPPHSTISERFAPLRGGSESAVMKSTTGTLNGLEFVRISPVSRSFCFHP